MSRKSTSAAVIFATLSLASTLLFLPMGGIRLPAPVEASNSEKATPVAGSDRDLKARIGEAYGKLPLSFEQNRGQTDKGVKFLSRGEGYTLLLTTTEAVLRLYKSHDSVAGDSLGERASQEQAVLRMKMAGADAAAHVSGENQLQGKSNYLIGNDRKKWHADIPTFSSVRVEKIYPGIDLVYYGTNERKLEFDFHLGPGADVKQIRLAFEGVDGLTLDALGNLVLQTGAGEVIQHAPVIYQDAAGGRRQVEGRYVMNAEREVGFEVGEYDQTKPLVIDPQLVYATFYGGSDLDFAADIAVDGSGNAYITGKTLSTDLLLRSPYQGPQVGFDVFVIKLNPSGSDVFYATYLGSSDDHDAGEAIAITSDGKACVTGTLFNAGNTSDFPTTPGRYQGNGFGLADRVDDAFLTVLTPGGNDLAYSTFLGGPFLDDGHGISVDAANKIYITGSTFGRFPIKNAFQHLLSGGISNTVNVDAFIAKFDPTQSGNSSLIYSTYLGGTGDEVGRDIAVTPEGVAFVVGVTGSTNFPQKSSSSLPAFQRNQGGVNDAFVAKISPSCELIYATYFGGNDVDEALSVAVGPDERAYVSGKTASSSTTFPLKNAFDSTREGGTDAFVAKFNADGTALFYSSFLGGNGGEEGRGIAIDSAGNAYVAGAHGSTNLTDVNGFPTSVQTGNGFIGKIEATDATGSTPAKLLYFDTFGGQGTGGNGIAVDPRGNVYITGLASNFFVATPGAFEPSFNGGNSDAHVIKVASTFPDTIGVFHPPATNRPLDDFRLRNSNTGGAPDLIADFGQPGDQALAGDWNGDGVDDVGVFRPSTAQFLLRQPTRLPTGVVVDVILALNFGLTGDKAVVGDWNGDGIDTPGVFRNGQWLLTNGPNTNNTTPPVGLIFNFGQPGDPPLTGDWNGDGIDSIGVLSLSASVIQLRNSNSAGAPDISFTFGGLSIDKLFMGDWNGDGIDTLGIFRDGQYLLLNVNAFAAADLVFNFGQAGDIPLTGDWDGKPGNTPPDSGVNNPSEGSNRVGQTQVFTTTCSDRDGWHDLSSIEFKIATSRGADRDDDDRDDRGRHKDDWRDQEDAKDDHDNDGPRSILWVRFDENRNVIGLYDPDLRVWREGSPGSNIVIENRFVRLFLLGTTVQGTGPLGPAVQITWMVQFKEQARGGYKQFLKITDDVGSSTGFDRVGSWKIRP